MNLVSLIIAPIIVTARPEGEPFSVSVIILMVLSFAGLVWAIWRSKKPTNFV
jgi:K(+)-stimulated pyrophosphate-energized sodium pump